MAEIRMVEKVARAIDPLAWVIPEGDYPAEKARREAKQFTSLSQARRAIEAMREPTPVMIAAGKFRYRDIDLGNGTTVRGLALGDDPFTSYQKMIDAALSEEVAG